MSETPNEVRTAEFKVYLRNLISSDPHVGQIEIINIETSMPKTLILDLADGTSVRLNFDRYTSDPVDAAYARTHGSR